MKSIKTDCYNSWEESCVKLDLWICKLTKDKSMIYNHVKRKWISTWISEHHTKLWVIECLKVLILEKRTCWFHKEWSDNTLALHTCAMNPWIIDNSLYEIAIIKRGHEEPKKLPWVWESLTEGWDHNLWKANSQTRSARVAKSSCNARSYPIRFGRKPKSQDERKERLVHVRVSFDYCGFS